MLLIVDVVTLLGVLVLTAVAGVDVITWVVNVGPSTVQVYKQSITIVRTYVHPQYFAWLTLHSYVRTYVRIS